MSTAGENAKTNANDRPKSEKRSVSDLYPSRFRGWAFKTPTGTVPTNPTKAETEPFVALAESGTFLQKLVFDSPEFHAAFREYAVSVADDPTKLVQWAKDYHAGRVAFLIVRGWKNSPIKIMPNGDMNDGQHRLLAAVFMDLKEVDVVVLHPEPVAGVALPST
jgi:hypothetical protein